MLRKVLHSGIDYAQSCSFSRKISQICFTSDFRKGNHLNVSQQLILLTSVLDQNGHCKYSIVEK